MAPKIQNKRMTAKIKNPRMTPKLLKSKNYTKDTKIQE